jgi:hypothetical protein
MLGRSLCFTVPPLKRPDTGPAAPVDVSEENIEKLLAKLPPKPSRPVDQYNTVEINRAFDEMTIPDNSLPLLDGPHVQPLAGATQEESVACTVDTRGEYDVVGEQNTLPVDQLERLSR